MSITIDFHFEEHEMFITSGNMKVRFKDYSRTVWNDITKTRQIEKRTIDMADIAEEYAAHINNLKASVLAGITENTIEHCRFIINEISKISREHLAFVYKLVIKNDKKRQNRNTSGIYAVCVDRDTGKQICIVCEATPEKLKRCGGCGTTCYCSAECQKADWKEHKLVCKTAKNIPNYA